MDGKSSTTALSSFLPIIDLAKARDQAQRLAVARQLVHALETVGFLFLDNVEGFDSERLLSNARWFFNLRDDQKLQVSRKLWNVDSQNHYRGTIMIDKCSC
jgi:isopenicillin N synthase-like dioxygenase